MLVEHAAHPRVLSVFVYLIVIDIFGMPHLLHEDFFAIVDVEVVFVGMADQFTIEGIVFAVVLAGGGH